MYPYMECDAMQFNAMQRDATQHIAMYACLTNRRLKILKLGPGSLGYEGLVCFCS